ncbi:MAG: hypothetical protein DI529_17915 [Chryseobacterium sp.]|nr:MAG: hypothetical protein DI529_17915 [Chryseobacterium sp.]
MNENLPKSKFYLEQQTLIKPILKKEKEPFILIISWNKSMLSQENMTYTALLYNPSSGGKKLFRTTEEKPKEVIVSENLSDAHFTELVYILDNYLADKEKYLLSLQDSFSSSEIGSPYYIYDFMKNKKLKINSFFFDKDGKIIQ